MSPRERADAYLTISEGYSLGGLHWSTRGDALDYSDGSTLALVEEIAQVLEGLFGCPPVPPFEYVLSLLAVVKDSPDELLPSWRRLHRAYAERGAGAVGRNFGVLIAEMCRTLPPAVNPPEWHEVAAALDRLRRNGVHRRPHLVTEPPLSVVKFMQWAADRFHAFDDDALAHWLSYGCSPTTAGEKLAEPVEALPARIARLVRDAKRRPRLVGAAVLTPYLDAALTFPPRRRNPDSLPQGGYADVATRGDPERLLPGQFALDPDEFVRRFAENELLYFKREEPHAAEAPERVVVLDQGVRTWGGVRLGLAAAALSLLRRDAKRFGPARLAATSAHHSLDPAGDDLGVLADVLEASDLTANPAERLRSALVVEATAPRDVILLTHPRSLREPAVLAAAKELRPADRLLTLTVDDAGRAELGEWTDRGHMALRSFRVDLVAAEAARVEGDAAPAPPAKGWSPWSGDVEPVGFPFRPGLVVEPTLMGFDAGGDWLVIAGAAGMLHGLAFDGSPPEVLPRPAKDGAVMTRVDAILGVNGGVVVCGRMVTRTRPAVTVFVSSPGTESSMFAGASAPADHGEQFVAAHYDRATRRVAVHFLGPVSGLWEWMSFPDLHCVAVAGKSLQCAVDLTNREPYFGFAAGESAGRARLAWDRARTAGGSPPRVLPVRAVWSKSADTLKEPFLHRLGDTLKVKNADPPWVAFEPTRDGKPLLAGAAIHQAQLAGTTLAVSASRSGAQTLTLFRGPDGAVVADWPWGPQGSPFALLPDGERVARCQARWEVVVSPTSAAGQPLAVAGSARLHPDLRCDLGAWPFWLTAWAGNIEHRFEIVDDRLVHDPRRGMPPAQLPNVGRDAPVARALDTKRFPLKWRRVAGGFTAVVDRAGQVVLFGRGGDAVAAFIVRRERAAVALPDGTVWGAVELIGSPETPGASGKIAKAILAARA